MQLLGHLSGRRRHRATRHLVAALLLPAFLMFGAGDAVTLQLCPHHAPAPGSSEDRAPAPGDESGQGLPDSSPHTEHQGTEDDHHGTEHDHHAPDGHEHAPCGCAHSCHAGSGPPEVVASLPVVADAPAGELPALRPAGDRARRPHLIPHALPFSLAPPTA
jgi:hypothetical protein